MKKLRFFGLNLFLLSIAVKFLESSGIRVLFTVFPRFLRPFAPQHRLHELARSPVLHSPTSSSSPLHVMHLISVERENLNATVHGFDTK